MVSFTFLTLFNPQWLRKVRVFNVRLHTKSPHPDRFIHFFPPICPSSTQNSQIHLMDALVIHIGAGTHSQSLNRQYKRLLKSALSHDLLKASEIIEKSPLTNTGYGSSLDIEGNANCDCTLATLLLAKLENLLSLFAVGDCATPTLACQQVTAKLEEMYGPRSVKGILGLLKPTSLPFTTARLICPDLPVDDLVLPKTKQIYVKYQDLVTRMEKLREPSANDIIEAHQNSFLTEISQVDVQDTVGYIELGTVSTIACSSGGSFLRLPGRMSCAGVFGAGIGVGRAGNMEVYCLCSGNGDDIIKMNLGAHISDRLSCELLESLEWPDLGTRMVEMVRERGESVHLNAVDQNLNHILYVGVIAVVRKGDQRRLVFCHSTETFYFGFRRQNDTEIVLSRQSKPGLFLCGEYKL